MPSGSENSSVSWGNPIRAPCYPGLGPILPSKGRPAMTMYVGLDVSLKTTSIV